MKRKNLAVLLLLTAAPTTSISPTVAPSIPATTASTDPPTADEGVLNLNFEIQRPFVPELEDSNSPEFQDLSRNVTTELNRGYSKAFPGKYSRCNVAGFSRGSPIGLATFRMESTAVRANLIFANQSVVPSVTEAETALENGLNDSAVFLNVIPNSINAENPANTTASTPTSSAMTTNKPQELITFLLPLTLVIYFMSLDTKTS